jgi:hypothetical protein
MKKTRKHKTIQAIKQKLISTVEEIAQALIPDNSPVPVPVAVENKDRRLHER